MSAIKYQTFSTRHTYKTSRTEKTFFGSEYVVQYDRPAYPTYADVYDAAAAFATSVGERLVAITGTPFAVVSINNSDYTGGDVTVWYREEAKP